VLASISVRFGLRHCEVGMFLGIETVRGVGWISLMAILTSWSSNSARDEAGEETVEDVLIDKAWLPDFRVIITFLQNCL
jgi:hypothetical protein